MNNKEIKVLKNRIAIKSLTRILLFSIIAYGVVLILIDGVYNNFIANVVYDASTEFYYWCTLNKATILIFIYLIIFAITTFIVIRNSSNNMVEIISSVDGILKEPNREVQLPDELLTLEGKMNSIRLDLISSQNEAKEAMQKKNDLIMYMAHDLKTPLTSIIGYLTLLTDEKEIPKNLQEKYLKITLDKSLRVEDLTNQFFEITRYNLNSMPITKQNIDLTFLLEQLIEETYPMLQEKKLKCEYSKSSNISFYGDGDKLARAFANLLKNAINYSYENTTIYIDIKGEANKINIVFKNNGDKIPEYKLEKIFEKFYRGDEARTSKSGGAGLGLAITKEIIELHGGKIYAKNEEEFIEFHVELEN